VVLMTPPWRSDLNAVQDLGREEVLAARPQGGCL
jgi:hypothetical protein